MSLEHALRHYTECLERYGLTHAAVNQPPETQATRYQWLIETLAKEPPGSVLDVACGLGHFVEPFRHLWPTVPYLGVDLTPGMIDGARELWPAEAFVVGDMRSLEPGLADYVVSCCPFSFIDPPDVALAIQSMFAACRRGLLLVVNQGPFEAEMAALGARTTADHWGVGHLLTAWH